MPTPPPLHPMFFFFNTHPSSKPMPPPPMGCPLHLKMKPPPIEKQSHPHWKRKPPSRKWFLEKNIKKIRNCHLPKIPSIHNFLSWSIQNFIRKWNSLLEIIITWLINLANKLNDVEKFLISFYEKLGKYWPYCAR